MGTLFTHHQKCVILDSQGSGETRKITAFIGGLDLCDGRYDTPEHRLFQDIDTIFKGDFHNPTFPVSGFLHIRLSALVRVHRYFWYDALLTWRVRGFFLWAYNRNT